MLGGKHLLLSDIWKDFTCSPQNCSSLATDLSSPAEASRQESVGSPMPSLCLSHCVLVATLCTLSFLLVGMGQMDSCLGSNKTNSLLQSLYLSLPSVTL